MKKIILILCLAVAGIINANAQTVIVRHPARRVVVTPVRTVVVRPARRVVVARPVVVTRHRMVVVHH